MVILVLVFSFCVHTLPDVLLANVQSISNKMDINFSSTYLINVGVVQAGPAPSWAAGPVQSRASQTQMGGPSPAEP